METIKDLKQHLKNVLESLENYGENTRLEIVDNTYWLKGGQDFICVRGVGFIDLEYPTNLQEWEFETIRDLKAYGIDIKNEQKVKDYINKNIAFLEDIKEEEISEDDINDFLRKIGL